MPKLSPKSLAVLSLIAEGHSYGQIVDSHPELTYLDIFQAAEEALRLSDSNSDYHERVSQIREKYRRAYEKWDPNEDARLRDLFSTETRIAELASLFERQPSAMRSRLRKLGLDTND